MVPPPHTKSAFERENMPLFILLVLLINGGECIPTETFNKYLIESTNSSEECLVQKEAFLDGLRNNDDWALRSR